MHDYYRCDLCFKPVRARLNDLIEHCEAYHYGQSPDLIFPGHGLHYSPMDPALKRKLVERGERKMGQALLGSVYFNPSPPPFEIIKEGESPIQHPIAKPQMKPILGSDAWEELVVQGWVTIATENTSNGEIAVMEKF